ncbi:uncharacterized protein LOC108889093 [Xyrichtys novacula]|uniref:Uncharacterized protein LOC108889093 n=1 Tax=Xyrichtys novacula TaxID=13765 RepID=A0AAV1EX52_XYRNO|nr:uncharacterized protein LOC108889093 [Xyrichtys novacula]
MFLCLRDIQQSSSFSSSAAFLLFTNHCLREFLPSKIQTPCPQRGEDPGYTARLPGLTLKQPQWLPSCWGCSRCYCQSLWRMLAILCPLSLSCRWSLECFERNPSKLLLQGCACSNVVGLLGATLALCLYSYGLSSVQNVAPCPPYSHDLDYRSSSYKCPGDLLAAHSWSLLFLLLLYNTGAVLLHCILSVSALRALKTN